MNFLDLKNIRLITTEKCNQCCHYCYEVKNRSNVVVDFSIAKKALSKMNNGSNIMFFGGEPFLYITIMKDVMEWGYEFKNFKFEIGTNGQIIDREFFRDYCNNTKVFLSIDGPEHVHDLNRGKGSWKKAMEFYDAFYEETNNSQIIISPTYYKNTVSSLFETIKWIFELEKNNVKNNLHLNIASPYEYEENDFVELSKQVDLIVEWYLKEKIYETNWSLLPFKLAEESLFASIWSFPPDPRMVSNRLQPVVSKNEKNSCDDKFNHSINHSGELISCQRQFWEYRNNRAYLYHRDQEDYDGLDYTAISYKDIKKCKYCEKWACRLCPSTWRTSNAETLELYEPPEYWCKIVKLIHKKLYTYINKRYVGCLY